MISYLIVFYILIIKLFPNRKEFENDTNDLYGLIFISLLLSHLILGFTSLVILTFNFGNFPILFISCLALGISILFEKNANYENRSTMDPMFNVSGWESSILNPKGAANPMGPLGTPKTAI